MAAAVVSITVEDILQSLEERMKLGEQWGVEREFIEIRELLFSIRGELPMAEKKYGHSLKLQEWVQKLKHAGFDAEDLLEDLSMKDALWHRKRKVRRLFGAIGSLMFRWRTRAGLRDAARQLRELIRLDLISFVRNIPDEIGETDEEASVVPLIGRDDKKRQLMLWLLERGLEPKREVFVQGGIGTGKTSLVREVLSESEVNRHFDVVIWVNASPPFDENRMAGDIIASLTNGVATEEENIVEEQLHLRVGKLIDGRKKYLFILDDLSLQDSERQRWLRFRSFLEGGATGSKILVTTRDPMYYDGSHIISLQLLTPEDSVDLLLKTASKGRADELMDPAKLQIAEEVVTLKYSRHPLIIRAVGDYLSLQHDTSDWSRLRDMLHGPLERGVRSTLLHGGYPYGHFSPMVKRYNHLPPRIQRCFGLCSLFPRGHVIDRQTLAELWIALGYIKSSNEDHRLLEDIANDYFDRLLGEELFRVQKFDTFGKVRSVVLHPDVEGLAHSVAGWECQAPSWNDFLSQEEAQKARHASIIDDLTFKYPFNLRRLQTLLFFANERLKPEGLCKYLIPSERHAHARVLEVARMNVEAMPKAVWKLSHLRFLNLSDNRRIKTLPPAITGLLNLQTLKLSGCWALKELPPDMRKMVSLRHLYIDGCRKLRLMPKGLGDLNFLNILTDFILPPDDSSSIDSANLADLCKLNDLRGSLRITNLGYSEAARETFKKQGLLDEKNSLEYLELIFMNLPTDTALLDMLRPHPNLKGLRIDNYGATQFPEWMARPLTYLPNLVEVALIGWENCEYLPEFGQLRHLKSLTIQGLPDLLRMDSGPELSSSDLANNAQPFGKLSMLCIRDCPKLECLPMTPRLEKLTLVDVGEQLFRHPFCIASLKTLRLENIELLDHLPKHWLRDLTCLKELHIGSCPSLVSLSRGMMHLENLESLSIWNCKNLDLSKDEENNVMMELHGLKSLKFLTIYKASKMEYLPEWLSRVYTLRFLIIRSSPNLVALSEWIGNLRSLQLIELVHCPRITSLPAGMYYFTSDFPRKLSIVGCPGLQSEGINHSHKL